MFPLELTTDQLGMDTELRSCSVKLYRATAGAQPTESISAEALDRVRSLLDPTLSELDEDDAVVRVYGKPLVMDSDMFGGYEMNLEIGEPKSFENETAVLECLQARLLKETELLTEAIGRGEELVQVYCTGMLDIVQTTLSGVRYLLGCLHEANEHGK